MGSELIKDLRSVDSVPVVRRGGVRRVAEEGP